VLACKAAIRRCRSIVLERIGVRVFVTEARSLPTFPASSPGRCAGRQREVAEASAHGNSKMSSRIGQRYAAERRVAVVSGIWHAPALT